MKVTQTMKCKLNWFGKCYAEKVRYNGEHPWDECSWCHKPLKGTFWSVTTEDGIQEYFGVSCFKNLLWEEYEI